MCVFACECVCVCVCVFDRLVGRFLALSPEFCFVVEDQHGVCGYVLAARDAYTFMMKTRDTWTPSMCEKYPKPLQDDISPAEVGEQYGVGANCVHLISSNTFNSCIVSSQLQIVHSGHGQQSCA